MYHQEVPTPILAGSPLPMIPPLHIQLLGGFRLVSDARPITAVDLPRLQALLAYLVLHRHVPQSRQYLAFLLWPDTTDAQARSNLRTLLHRLRQALPEADVRLHTDSQTVFWCPDAPYILDVADFEHALAQADQAERAGDQAALRAALAAAVEVYRGDLLPGWYDDWVLRERDRLRLAYLAALGRLILLLEQECEYAAAIGAAQRLLQHDPLHEVTYQHLMRLHACSGDRASAVRVYRTCVTVLDRELGVEPSPATHEVYERLLRAEGSIDPPLDRPAPPSLVAQPHNLPISLTSFIGRSRERSEVARLLSRTRLLTLTGAGGCGKTRLALTVASEVAPTYPDGVWLVELAALANGSLVPQAVAAVLEVHEEPHRPLIATLADALRPRKLLLVLDNCEHLLAACIQLVEGLLKTCPRIHILATSREALGSAGETAWLVPSLAQPSLDHLSPLEELQQCESIRLFTDRAAAVLPTFVLTHEQAGAVAQVCRRLDGIPLAIELAAARVKLLAVAQLAARLDNCFGLLTSGSRTALPRQQTLRATIDWSYDLLSEPERTVFRRLAVFAGGWTLEAAEAICAGAGIDEHNVLDLLAHLVDKSLVVVDIQDTPTGRSAARYRLLETVRQYSRERLREAGELEMVQQWHAHFFLALAEAAEPQLWGMERAEWLARLESEHDNLRAALAWSQVAPDSAEVRMRLVGALWWFWFMRYYVSESWAWLTAILERRGDASEPAQAKALSRAGIQAWFLSDYARATSYCTEGLALGRKLGDKFATAYALHGLGLVALDRGDSQAATLFEESLALSRELGIIWGVAWSLFRLGQVEWMVAAQGDAARARSLFEESLATFRYIGDEMGVAHVLLGLGSVAERQGDLAQAVALYEESVALCRKLGEKGAMVHVLHGLGQVVMHQGDLERATALYHECLALCQELGEKRALALGLEGLAGVTATRGQPERAVRLLGAAAAVRDSSDISVQPGERPVYDRSVAAMRAQLDEAIFATAWAEGHAMTLEHAIDYAREPNESCA
ncbi:MAG: AfsR/SARP family transcriptional regulator [Roseiflexaceae bacterium]